jgi:hypothetical protein
VNLSEELKSLAMLNNLEYDPNATYVYDLMADGLVWSDESPPEPQKSEQAFRYLLMYRTSLIEAKEIEAIRELWAVAKQQYPKWPGFHPSRCTPMDELQMDIEQKRKQTEEEFDVA